MKLSERARGQGVSYRTALNWFHAGTLPVSARPLPTGTIVVEPSAEPSGRTVAYCRVTRSLSWSAYDLRKTWNQAKNTTAPWWAENSKEAYSSGLANLATALGNWHASKNGTRRGPKVRFPKFK